MEPKPSFKRDQAPTVSNSGSSAIRVMIVDDSLTVRTVFSRLVQADADLEVASTASNAERAIAILRDDPVDVILLDLEMPGMGGLEALPTILKTAKSAKVLVVSSLTEDGAEHTVAALSMGAADTMLKPRPGGFDDAYRASLVEKIKALGAPTAPQQAVLAESEGTSRDKCSAKTPEVVAIGASTGGIHALNIILRGLPPQFDLPILITQHLPANFIPVFARQVEMAAARKTVIAEDGTVVRRGEIAIATGHSHMMLTRRGDMLVTKIMTDAVPSGCRPSVDPMLTSLAENFDGRALAVILSGMGKDGSRGAADLVAAGGAVIAQDAETSAVWGMPGAVTKAGLTSAVLPPEGLLKEIVERCGVKAWK
ncbi:Chemotaxis response regulator protein-glutamate methylesterase of group 1 operon [Altererythrobacter insulae]|nr:Chemotaxis response regulator protein-glutamate methylesterase of group 1 operon [Altererythrobacter insulae]